MEELPFNEGIDRWYPLAHRIFEDAATPEDHNAEVHVLISRMDKTQVHPTFRDHRAIQISPVDAPSLLTYSGCAHTSSSATNAQKVGRSRWEGCSS